MDVIFHFFKKVISLAVFMSFLIGFFLKLQQFALCKEIPEIFASRIWNPGILSGEIWNSAQGIQNPINDWNPDSSPLTNNLGSFYVCGKLPTYSSSKPTFCPK